MTPNGKPSPKLKIPCANNTCGFDPHHRHKKETPQLVWGVSFLFAACERVEQHGPALQGERSALRAVAQCAGDPHHQYPPQLVWGVSFLSAACNTARIKKAPETFAGVPGAGFYAGTQASSRLTMASIWSKHSSIWRTRVNWVRARSRLWSGRAVWK